MLYLEESVREVDLLIEGGLVADGTDAPLRRTIVGIAGNRIAFVSDRRAKVRAGDVLDAGGLVVAPGFVDIHAHTDLSHLADPHSLSKVHDGVTTEISGNCGSSAFPSADEVEAASELAQLGIVPDWSDFSGYARRIESRGTGINRAYLVGHGTLRASVLGYDDRPATDTETARMERLLDEALAAGAIGLSTGLIYAPSCFAPAEEITRLARVVARRDGMYATHMRGECATLLEAVEEALAVATATGVRTQLSHLKASRRENWPKLEGAIARIAEARAGGAHVQADRYPYTATHTGLDSVLPDWVKEGGRARLVARLADPALRASLHAFLEEAFSPDFWDHVVLSHCPVPWDRRVVGETVTSVARDMGMPAARACLEIVAQQRGEATAIFHVLSEDNLRRVLRLPYVMIGSDAGARAPTGPTATGRPHPRAYGTFARVLGRYHRELGILDLTEAVRKMTSMPAAQAGLRDRGLLAPGFAADVCVFDPATVIDRATFEDPARFSAGIVHVIVNGRVVLRDGVHQGTLAGRVLRPEPRPHAEAVS